MQHVKPSQQHKRSADGVCTFKCSTGIQASAVQVSAGSSHAIQQGKAFALYRYSQQRASSQVGWLLSRSASEQMTSRLTSSLTHSTLAPPQTSPHPSTHHPTGPLACSSFTSLAGIHSLWYFENCHDWSRPCMAKKNSTRRLQCGKRTELRMEREQGKAQAGESTSGRTMCWGLAWHFWVMECIKAFGVRRACVGAASLSAMLFTSTYFAKASYDKGRKITNIKGRTVSALRRHIGTFCSQKQPKVYCPGTSTTTITTGAQTICVARAVQRSMMVNVLKLYSA